MVCAGDSASCELNKQMNNKVKIYNGFIVFWHFVSKQHQVQFGINRCEVHPGGKKRAVEGRLALGSSVYCQNMHFITWIKRTFSNHQHKIITDGSVHG